MSRSSYCQVRLWLRLSFIENTVVIPCIWVWVWLQFAGQPAENHNPVPSRTAVSRQAASKGLGNSDPHARTSIPLSYAPRRTDRYHAHAFPVGDKAHPFYTPGLSECVKTVPPVTGCEAAYLFPADIDVCLSDKKRQDRQLVATERGDAASDVRLEGDAEDRNGKKGGEDAASLRAGRVVTRTGHLKSGVGHEMDERGDEPMVETEVEGRASNEEDVTGSLVMHVRSGDIFVDPVHPSYGQVRTCVWYCSVSQIRLLLRGFSCYFHHIVLSLLSFYSYWPPTIADVPF